MCSSSQGFHVFLNVIRDSINDLQLLPENREVQKSFCTVARPPTDNPHEISTEKVRGAKESARLATQLPARMMETKVPVMFRPEAILLCTSVNMVDETNDSQQQVSGSK